MVKVIVLLFVCLALAAFATAKPLSHEESPKPINNNVIGTHTRHKRCLIDLFEGVRHAVRSLIKDVRILHYERHRRRHRQFLQVGNGINNTNHINNHYYLN
ncbi:uncharacterized protein LOC123655007 [Melitaea cinxia]|uniref:uncharacterized protein LOC123655007 n=1 Tax=Melitaea cinxia TaxID=113334 RepID=UPI001E2717BC|nr:uncharacterized protein LOC123655007 [Melitaea cinxia]XP_045446816.1 uncharacterized protein LOC123655007 [Melitaea cinxia]